MDFSIPHSPGLQFGSLFCIGRNYAGHVAEMKSRPATDPVVFLKPRSSIIFSGNSVLLPPVSKEVHHEVELVVLIGSELRKVESEAALQGVQAVAVGLDITARDIQASAKKNGLPWTLAKGFRTFSPIGNFHPCTPETDLQNLNLQVKVNGEIRQNGNTSGMLFPVSVLISYLSEHFTLTPGDLVFTGTPEGVSPIRPGDTIEASLGENLSKLYVDVRKKEE